MKIFISWSGTSSRLVAEALSDWLQRVIQAVKPFYSPDIDKGAKWSNEIDAALEGTRFGIICLTPDNLQSEWVHYESGALSKTKDASIWTFLLELKPTDVKQPLGRFQHTLAEKSDVLKMLKSINNKLTEVGGESLKENLLEELFEESWTKLETRLETAKKSIELEPGSGDDKSTAGGRSENDKLDEILEILRNQQRRISKLENPLIESIPERYRNSSERITSLQFKVEKNENNEETEDLEADIVKLIKRNLPTSDTLYNIDKFTNYFAVEIQFKPPYHLSHIEIFKGKAFSDIPGRIIDWVNNIV